MGKGKRKSETADARGGRYVMLPHCLLASAAFRTASPRAIKVLLALCSKHDGFNNGRIALGARELAELVDSRNNAANAKALRECMERGLVELARVHPRGCRLASEYRLTFIGVGDDAATNDYLTWQPGDAGTRWKVSPQNGKNRVSETTTRTALRVSETETGEETSRFGNHNASNAKLPILGSAPVSDSTTHIGNHTRSQSARPSRVGEKASGLVSAAPDPTELRGRVLDAVADAGRGSQGQLAALAGIRPAALSKFLHDSGSLNEQSRIRLTCALPKIAARQTERATA